MAVKHLIENLTIPLSANQKDLLIKSASSITDTKLKSGISHGFGYHHGGLLPETRSIIEQLFRNGQLPVLVTTSTLATGVNLPAHLVIIKSTKFYNQGGFQDYPASAVLQMIGRAGRPQFDTEATALILTSIADKVSKV
ncbi:probable ATP-dependent DNA helicase HFM1 [Coccinella septempunctata]|uniref:probable ATP-dependent DNA helicase HFM1 n=1 Tax=Coccinella septempunctata TaxID=41139 RepID=UPI001D0906DE|nr:probable ATP-dependent DNA helicase HFM1 [Coccinella septempunctata]